LSSQSPPADPTPAPPLSVAPARSRVACAVAAWVVN
jgi:hypothetical protein